MSIGTMDARLYPLMAGGGGSTQRGTFTAASLTWTGFSNPEVLDFTFSWVKSGGLVGLWISSSTTLVATSGTTAFSFQSIPAAIRYCSVHGILKAMCDGSLRPT